MDFFGRHTQFRSQERQKCWVVVSLDAGGKRSLLSHIVFIELVSDLAENRNELRLLVKLEIGIDVPVNFNVRELERACSLGSRTVDGQGGDSKQRSVDLDELGCE